MTEDSLASPSALGFLQRVHSRNAAAVRQAHAHGLNGAGHGVGCVHAPTCSGTRTRITHNVMAVFVIYEPGCIGPCTPELTYVALPYGRN